MLTDTNVTSSHVLMDDFFKHVTQHNCSHWGESKENKKKFFMGLKAKKRSYYTSCYKREMKN